LPDGSGAVLLRLRDTVTEQEDETRPGPIDGLARILRELIKTPRFRQSVGILMSELDPQSARLLVRTLMWEDFSFFLSLAGSSPDVINTWVIALDELMEQMSKMPEPLLTDFASGMVGKLNGEALGSAMAGALELIASISVSEDEGMRDSLEGLRHDVAKGFARDDGSAAERLVEQTMPIVSAWMGRVGSESLVEGSPANRAVKAFSEGIRQAARENPEFVEGVVTPLADAWRDAFEEAGGTDE
jgi:hypothetical protein